MSLPVVDPQSLTTSGLACTLPFLCWRMYRSILGNHGAKLFPIDWINYISNLKCQLVSSNTCHPDTWFHEWAPVCHLVAHATPPHHHHQRLPLQVALTLSLCHPHGLVSQQPPAKALEQLLLVSKLKTVVHLGQVGCLDISSNLLQNSVHSLVEWRDPSVLKG